MSSGVVRLFVIALTTLTGLLSGQVKIQSVIRGTVTYGPHTAVPLDAAIAVRLEDASRQDAPAKVLSESIISPAGQETPIPFEVSYDPAEIDPSHTYQVRATLTANGTLLLTSTSAYRVLTHGAPSRAAIVLQKPGAIPVAGRSGTPLQETNWRLTQLGGQPLVLADEGGNDPEIVLHGNQNKVSGSGGCKSIVGTYVLSQNALKFTLADTTGFACSPRVIQQEKTFANALKATRSYRIHGDTLELLLESEVLATFQAQKKK